MRPSFVEMFFYTPDAEGIAAADYLAGRGRTGFSNVVAGSFLSLLRRPRRPNVSFSSDRLREARHTLRGHDRNPRVLPVTHSYLSPTPSDFGHVS